jgi:transmembrane sensor
MNRMDRNSMDTAAADWLARLREPEVSLEETLAWQDWMREATSHAEAFERMEELSNVLRSMPRPRRPLPCPSPAERGRGWKMAIAASIVAISIAGAWAFYRHSSSSMQTAVGENRAVELEDGSRVTLGGDSHLKVSITDTARRIELTRGEAFFTVVKDPVRPFTVRAGDAPVTAVGTEFNVRRGHDRVVVAVVEGRVVVDAGARHGPLRLDAGQQTQVVRKGAQPAVASIDPAAVSGWQSGRLSFRLEPLSYVLEDVNRYSTKPVVVEDERVAALRVTGTIMGHNVKGWVGSLESALGVEVIEESDRIVLRGAR